LLFSICGSELVALGFGFVVEVSTSTSAIAMQ
jgi:hypothetical protein